jgi:putative DNA primase/helicase
MGFVPMAEKPKTKTRRAAAADEQRLTDVGNAHQFVADHSATVRHVPGWAWLVWDGRRWARDDAGRVQELAKQTVSRIFTEADAEIQGLLSGQREEADRNAAIKAAQKRWAWALRSHDARRIQSTLALAKSDPKIVANVEQFDADAFAFNVANGTIDLRTGRLKPHSQMDYITRLAPVQYDENAESEAWDKFLVGTFASDFPLCSWLQRFFGYCLTGDTREQCIAIAWGGGSNGKSVLFETVLDCMGDYGFKANAELLLASKSDRHETEKAALAGRRFVAACETGEGRRLNESLVKEATGGDRITARFMRQDHFTFPATFKLALATNHRPEIRGSDHGIWRRVRLIPFTRRFWRDGETPGPEELKADADLRDKLRAELPGILRWMVDGAVDWRRDGLGTCDSIAAATTEYREAEDTIGQFIADRCETSPQAECTAKDLYVAYKQWSEDRKDFVMNQKRFGARLGEMGFERFRNNGKRYRGIDLLPEIP